MPILFSCVAYKKIESQPPVRALFSDYGEKWSFTGEYQLLGDINNTCSIEERGKNLLMITSWGNRIVGVRDGSKGTFTFIHGGKKHVTINEMSDDGMILRGKMVQGASSYGESQFIYYRRIGTPQVADDLFHYSNIAVVDDSASSNSSSIFTQHVREGERVALVIGNGTYRSVPLRNPARDADAVSISLRRLGFTVIQKNDVGFRQMEQAMDQFYTSLSKGSVGLFYYAGHGIQVDGQNYLVPIDATIKSQSDTKYECIDAGRILGKMEDAGNAINIVILDACRNNPFAGSYRSASRGLARMDAPTGSIVAYSTAPGKVASDGEGQNGVYTKHLLRHMMTPGLDVNDIFIRTRMDVIKETDGEQVPWESSSLTGYFYFAGQKDKPEQ
jgi:hypothetical protein